VRENCNSERGIVVGTNSGEAVSGLLRRTSATHHIMEGSCAISYHFLFPKWHTAVLIVVHAFVDYCGSAIFGRAAQSRSLRYRTPATSRLIFVGQGRRMETSSGGPKTVVRISEHSTLAAGPTLAPHTSQSKEQDCWSCTGLPAVPLASGYRCSLRLTQTPLEDIFL